MSIFIRNNSLSISFCIESLFGFGVTASQIQLGVFSFVVWKNLKMFGLILFTFLEEIYNLATQSWESFILGERFFLKNYVFNSLIKFGAVHIFKNFYEVLMIVSMFLSNFPFVLCYSIFENMIIHNIFYNPFDFCSISCSVPFLIPVFILIVGVFLQFSFKQRIYQFY